MTWWHWLIVHLSQETGTSNEASRSYAFWSGFGSDIGEITIVGALVAIYRKHNCHTEKCWRLAHHDIDVDGVTYRVCRKCHPHIAGPLHSERLSQMGAHHGR